MKSLQQPLVPGDRTVPWLSSIPDKWRMVPLKTVVSINAEALPESTPTEFAFRYIDISSVDEDGGIGDLETMTLGEAPSRARRLVRPGDTIVSTVRTYLQAVAFVGEEHADCIASTGFAVITPGPSVDHRFLFYWIRSAHVIDEVCARSTGVSYPAINATELGSFPFPDLPLEEQHRIAAYLDSRIAAIEGVIHQKMALVDVVWERHKAVVSAAVTHGLPPAREVADSNREWIGTIAAHWRMYRLRHLKDGPFLYGANAASGKDDRSHPRYIRITDVNPDGDLRDDTFCSLPPDEAAPYMLEDGDILLARSGATVGKAVMYRAEWGPACFAGYLIRVRPDRHRILPEYLRYFMQSAAYWDQVSLGTVQATIPNVSAERYADFDVPVPPLSEQEAIVAYLAEQTRHARNARDAVLQAVRALKEYRQALITACVTGRWLPEPLAETVA